MSRTTAGFLWCITCVLLLQLHQVWGQGSASWGSLNIISAPATDTTATFEAPPPNITDQFYEPLYFFAAESLSCIGNLVTGIYSVSNLTYYVYLDTVNNGPPSGAYGAIFKLHQHPGDGVISSATIAQAPIPSSSFPNTTDVIPVTATFTNPLQQALNTSHVYMLAFCGYPPGGDGNIYRFLYFFDQSYTGCFYFSNFFNDAGAWASDEPGHAVGATEFSYTSEGPPPSSGSPSLSPSLAFGVTIAIVIAVAITAV